MRDREHEVPHSESDHRRQRAPQSPEPIHDLAARVEEAEVERARGSDDQGGLGIRNTDAHSPERQDHLAARPHGPDETGAGSEPREHCSIRPDGAEETNGLCGDKRAAGPFGGGNASLSQGFGRVAQHDQQHCGADAADDMHPKYRLRRAGEMDHRRGDERPDEVAESEGAAEGRQRPCPEFPRYKACHERVPGQGEDGGGEADREDAEAE